MQIASNARPQDRVGQFDKMGGFDPPVLLMKFRRAPCMGVGFHFGAAQTTVAYINVYATRISNP